MRATARQSYPAHEQSYVVRGLVVFGLCLICSTSGWKIHMCCFIRGLCVFSSSMVKKDLVHSYGMNSRIENLDLKKESKQSSPGVVGKIVCL